jgi:parallel beta-helix repeat protein
MSVVRRAVRVFGVVAMWVVSSAPLGAAPQLGEVQVGVTGHFIAAANGVTDDTGAIQAALNAVAPGGTVTVEAGRTYLVNLSIGLRPKSGTRVKLTGATLRAPVGQGGRFFDLTSKTQITISGGTLLGNRSASAAAYGVLSVNSSDVTLDDVTFQDIYGDGIVVTGTPGGERISIRNCRFAGGRRSGVFIASGRHVTVENSAFDSTRGDAPEAGVAIQVNAGATVEHVRINRCSFRANGVGVSALKGSGTRLAHLSLGDNVIEANVRSGATIAAAHVVVDSNRIVGHIQGAGLHLGPGTLSATVTGNLLSNNFRGIQADGANMVNIAGNTVLGTGTRIGMGAGANGDGITCGAGPSLLVSQCVVTGNVIKGSAGNGIRIMRGSFMIVSSNVVSESGQKGISLLTADDSQVHGNSVSRSSLEASRAHDDILIGAGAKRNVITLNQCRQGATARSSIFVDNTSAGTLVAQNSIVGGAGFLNYSATTSASWDGSSANWNR